MTANENKIVEFVGECKDGGAPDCLVIDGIVLESRYNFWEEYAEMWTGIKNIPEALRYNVVSVFCDSKACALYTIKFLNPHDELLAVALAELFSQGLLDNKNGAGGHNGIWLDGFNHDIAPDWKEHD